MVQGFHVLKSRLLGPKVTGAGIALKRWSTVARGAEVVVASSPSCLEAFVARATLEIVAHAYSRDAVMDLDVVAL